MILGKPLRAYADSAYGCILDNEASYSAKRDSKV